MIINFQMTYLQKVDEEFRTPLIRILELDQGMPMIGFCKACKMAFANVDIEFVLRVRKIGCHSGEDELRLMI